MGSSFNTEKKMKAACSFALICALVTLPLAAQAPEPTYKETINWIVNKLASDAGYQKISGGFENDLVIQNPSIANCTLHYIEHKDVRSRTWSNVETNEFTVPLATVNFTDATREEYGAVTDVRSSTNSFHVIQEDSSLNLHSEKNWNWVSIKFGRPGVDDSNMAKRMAKAIDHAAKICKAETPKNNEPF
jgi:hypothetical protein